MTIRTKLAPLGMPEVDPYEPSTQLIEATGSADWSEVLPEGVYYLILAGGGGNWSNNGWNGQGGGGGAVWEGAFYNPSECLCTLHAGAIKEPAGSTLMLGDTLRLTCAGGTNASGGDTSGKGGAVTVDPGFEIVQQDICADGYSPGWNDSTVKTFCTINGWGTNGGRGKTSPYPGGFRLTYLRLEP